jgi:hypothetical protein
LGAVRPLHFTPTSASWINAVDNVFSIITRRRIRRCVCTIREHNRSPKPFVWTKPADVILANLSRLPVASE